VQQSSKPLYGEEAEGQEEADAGSYHRPRISENAQAIKQIKDLWSMNPRPSQREIAKIINYPASSTKYQIKNMLEKRELKRSNIIYFLMHFT
jgi:hypothetical protein